MGVGGRLRALIRASGLQQKEVALRSGIPQSSLSRLMTDDDADPRISTLIPIARALRVNLDDLAGTGEIPPSPLTPYERSPEIRDLVDTLVALPRHERIRFEGLLRLFTDALYATSPDDDAPYATRQPVRAADDELRDLRDPGDDDDDARGERGGYGQPQTTTGRPARGAAR